MPALQPSPESRRLTGASFAPFGSMHIHTTNSFAHAAPPTVTDSFGQSTPLPTQPTLTCLCCLSILSCRLLMPLILSSCVCHAVVLQQKATLFLRWDDRAAAASSLNLPCLLCFVQAARAYTEQSHSKRWKTREREEKIASGQSPFPGLPFRSCRNEIMIWPPQRSSVLGGM